MLPATLSSAARATNVRRLLPEDARLCTALRALTELDETSRGNGWFSPFTEAERYALLKGAARHPKAGWLQEPVGVALCKTLLIDGQNWLPDNMLEQGDRIWMAASLKLRQLDNAVTKGMGKQFSLGYFQDSIVNHRKVGFTVPLDAWFRDPPDRPRAGVDQLDFTLVGRP